MATVPPVAHTWLAGDDATSTNLQTLTALLNFLRGGSATAAPTFRAFLSSAAGGAALAAANGTSTCLPNVVSEDSDSAYNPTTGIYTVKTPGLWLFNGAVSFTGNATGVRQAWLTASDLASTGGPTFGTSPLTSAAVDSAGRAAATLLTRLSVNDTVRLQCYQSSGISLGYVYPPSSTLPGVAMQAAWLGA